MDLAVSKSPLGKGAPTRAGQLQPCRRPRSAVANLRKECAEEPCVSETEPVRHTAVLRSALNAEDDLKMFGAGL